MRKNNDALTVLMVLIALAAIAIWICYANEVWSSDLPWWIKLKLM
jgi:hypothetical protein